MHTYLALRVKGQGVYDGEKEPDPGGKTLSVHADLWYSATNRCSRHRAPIGRCTDARTDWPIGAFAFTERLLFGGPVFSSACVYEHAQCRAATLAGATAALTVGARKRFGKRHPRRGREGWGEERWRREGTGQRAFRVAHCCPRRACNGHREHLLTRRTHATSHRAPA